MILKKVFWFGSVSLKSFRGIEPGRSRVVDERTITSDIMHRFGHQMIITDKEGDVVEHVGKNVKKAHALRLYPNLNFPTAQPVIEPEAVVIEEPIEEVVAPEIEQLAVTQAADLPQTESVIEEQIIEEKVKSKKGRKPKFDQAPELTNDGTTDLSVE